MVVKAVTSDAGALPDLVSLHQPHLILWLDSELRLPEAGLERPVLMVSEREPVLVRSLSYGIRGALIGLPSRGEFLACLAEVAEGRPYLCQELLSRLVNIFGE